MTARSTDPVGPRPPEPPRTPWAWLQQGLGARLARYLSHEPPHRIAPEAVDELARVAACLRPGDVILVEGNSRFSTGIQYLTQSTWSHAALYVGDALAGRPAGRTPDGRRACVVEADRVDDLQHIVDLMRWLMPRPRIPARYRHRLLALGRGDPTRAICSTLVAEALHAVRYPSLPQVERVRRVDGLDDGVERASEVLHWRHVSLFVPRDFDRSPYFDIVKPALARGFDHRQLIWGDHLHDPAAADGAEAMAQGAPPPA